jgi:hypothetical protein
MIAAEARTHSDRAGAHLQVLKSLSSELERAMLAIAGNNLSELEDSVAAQEALSLELGELADFLRKAAVAQKPVEVDSVDPGLMREMRGAMSELKRLNLRYSILLKHSSRSVAMMAALLSSSRGQIPEGCGARPKIQTWSCRI